MADQTGKSSLSSLAARLRDPFQLRVFIAGGVLLIGYFAISSPLDGKIRQTTRKLEQGRRWQASALEVEQLEAQVKKFEPRIPSESDVNEWVQFLLVGTRKFPLKLNSLGLETPKRLGPYTAVVVCLEVEGRFGELDGFLSWIETNERLMRVDSAKIAPVRGHDGNLRMELTVLGVSG